MLAIINNILSNTTKNGKPYVVLDLFTEERKKINAKLWDTDKKDLSVKNHQIIDVNLIADDYNGRPSYVVLDYKLVEEKIDRSLFLPSLPEEKRVMYKGMFDGFVSQITVKKYVDLMSAFIADHGEKFMNWPASKVMHGAYLGGLFEHSVRVCAFSVSLAQQFGLMDGNKFSMDLIIVGSLLHDIGKMFTYDCQDGTIDYNEHEKLIGHPLFACMIIGSYQMKLKYKYLELLHVIASHMHKPEWGAVTTPKTFEADIVSYADEIEARASEFLRDDIDWQDKKAYSQARGDFIYRNSNAVQKSGKLLFKRKG
jgi:3'-5' exoribonuclease